MSERTTAATLAVTEQKHNPLKIALRLASAYSVEGEWGGGVQICTRSEFLSPITRSRTQSVSGMVPLPLLLSFLYEVDEVDQGWESLEAGSDQQEHQSNDSQCTDGQRIGLP